MYRRPLRHTGDLIGWGFARLNPGLPIERYHLARVPRAELEPVLLAVLDVGRRRGRAELAGEIFDRLGLGAELGPVEPHTMRIEPSVIARRRDPAAPIYAPRELAGAIRARSHTRKP